MFVTGNVFQSEIRQSWCLPNGRVPCLEIDTCTHTLMNTRTQRWINTCSVIIHPPLKVGYACHFRFLSCLGVLILLPPSQSLLLSKWQSRLKVRSIAQIPSHTVPYVMPHGDRGLRDELSPPQYHIDTSRDGLLASTYGHAPPSQGLRPSWTHTNTNLQLDPHNHTLSPAMFILEGVFQPAIIPPNPL